MQKREHGSRVHIALKNRRPVLVENALMAQILKDREPCLHVAGVNLRRGQTLVAQRLRHGDKRLDVFSQPRDDAVGLAKTHRRTIRAGGRNHQDRARSVRLLQPLIGAHGSVPKHEAARRARPASFVQQFANSARKLQPARHRAMAGENNLPVAIATRRIQRERDIETIRIDAGLRFQPK